MPDEKFRGIIFTPDDEPYLGRPSVFHFDQMISITMQENSRVAAATMQGGLSELQLAASQIIPQGLNLALSIRELVRQGYLFASAVLLRPLMERAAIISYLQKNSSAIAVWKEGWKFRERPSLASMLETISDQKVDLKKAREVCETLSHLVHGDPASSDLNLVPLGNAGMGYTPSKALNSPDVCDFVCFLVLTWLVVLLGMMCACFPQEQATN